MRRAGIIHCVGIDAPRFNLLRKRKQLPFHVARDENAAKWQDFSLDDAFRLRVELDFVAQESTETYPEGLGAEYASRLVTNSVSLTVGTAYLARPEIWVGVCVFEGLMQDGKTETYREHLCGSLSQILSKYHDEIPRQTEEGPYKYISGKRVFLANATRAARFVVQRAQELGLPEAEEIAE